MWISIQVRDLPLGQVERRRKEEHVGRSSEDDPGRRTAAPFTKAAEYRQPSTVQLGADSQSVIICQSWFRLDTTFATFDAVLRAVLPKWLWL
jgi:hypothetical protein